jgi:hypothetical protein
VVGGERCWRPRRLPATLEQRFALFTPLTALMLVPSV